MDQITPMPPVPSPPHGKEKFPFYASLGVFLAGLERLGERGIPPVIAVETFEDPLSRDLAGRLIRGFVALGLITEHGEPTGKLRNLIDVRGTDGWVLALQDLVLTAYAPVVPENWAALTKDQIHSSFVRVYGRDDPSLKKAEVFFLQLSVLARFPVPSRMVRHTRIMKRESGREAEAHFEEKEDEEMGQQGSLERAIPLPSPIIAPTAPDRLDQFLSIIDSDDMSEREAKAVVTLIKYFKRQRQN